MLPSEITAVLKWFEELALAGEAWHFRPADLDESPEEYCQALAEHIVGTLGYPQ
jgi:hypothetical protein